MVADRAGDGVARDSESIVNGRTLLVAGASGLVGSAVLRLAQRDPSWTRVAALARRPLPPTDATSPGRAEVRLVDFEDLARFPRALEADVVVCALGSTLRRAGTKEAFRRVDFSYALAVAVGALAGGARHFLIVSSLGANPRSRLFYPRVKGEVEAAVSNLQYRAVTIVRPSLLLGVREEFRMGEEVAKRLGWLAPLRYRPVPASVVASAMLRCARDDVAGRHIIESAEIWSLAALDGGETHAAAE